MKHSTFDVEQILANETFESDIDTSFEALPPIAPPVDFVARVMGEVAKLPAHRAALVSPWGDLDAMMVLSERDRLC